MNKLSGRENFWIGLIVGYFLEENCAKCLEAIDAYRGSLKEGASYTRQELLFLEVDCYLRQNESVKAITTLEKGMSDVLNELQAKEKLATLLGKAGTFEVDGVSRDGIEESRKIWSDLFERTRFLLVFSRPDNRMNYLYLRGLECCELRDFSSFDRLTRLQLPSTSLALSPEQTQRLRAFYDALYEKLPTCLVVRHVQLHLRDESEFVPLCKEMIIEASRLESAWRIEA